MANSRQPSALAEMTARESRLIGIAWRAGVEDDFETDEGDSPPQANNVSDNATVRTTHGKHVIDLRQKWLGISTIRVPRSISAASDFVKQSQPALFVQSTLASTQRLGNL